MLKAILPVKVLFLIFRRYTMAEEYFSRKRLAELHAKHFEIAAKAHKVPQEVIAKQVEELKMRIMNDEELELLAENLNEVISKFQPLIDKRVESLSHDVAHGIPVRFPRN